MASDTDDKFDREFAPHPAGSLTDLEQLPGQFRSFANEVRSALELLVNRIEPKLDRITEIVRDYGERIRALEAHAHRTDARFDALEALRISKPRPRARRK